MKNNLSFAQPLAAGAGFTLVEILLALAILGVGLVSILSVFVVGTNSVRRTIAMTEASLIAQMVMADYKSKGYDRLAIGIEEKGSIYNSSGKHIYPDFSYRANINYVSDVTNLKSIDLMIEYKGKDFLNFTTHIAKYEP